jgi:murein DD-endopeptidase MepM/ murein hydrolase activator NlpD
MKLVKTFIFICVFLHCSFIPAQKEAATKIDYSDLFQKNLKFISNGFILPVGKNGSGKGYYVAQGFGVKNKKFGGNFHLGEDWNGVGGGNTDYGDPVYSVSNGLVVFAGFGGPGWGDVIRIIHFVSNKKSEYFVESVYGHVSKMFVKEGDFVKKGFKIAEIGDANGIYPAHLHLELRDNPDMELGGGYASELTGFLNPRKFIKKHK